MKFLAALTVGATVALAIAVPSSEPAGLERRQGRTTRNDLENGDAGDCPSVIMIYARGSTEPGNMGITVGPALASAMERAFPNDIWIQGVGGPYTAALAPNALPKGTNQASIDEATRLFELANSKCPNAAVVTGGYSQGSAVVGNALTEAGATIQDQVKGAVLFGYTKNQQNNGVIINYPPEKTEVFCNRGDAVCTGSLAILPAHLQYTGVAGDEAPAFLEQRIAAA
ncbi:hypothetical protein jhhlp_008680 [Lomentospora prolificans]|uniref:Cutinase n=1 Tax=Lomentospora prolificans TaxID=41688 RepID=A0A2N3MYQ1_9PEZI|nr:hypothetical protein jhhlp_008680 [Lomentospora prolificans]